MEKRSGYLFVALSFIALYGSPLLSMGTSSTSKTVTQPQSLSSDEILAKILEQKKQELRTEKQEYLKDFFEKWFPKVEQYMPELRKEWPKYPVTGNLSYTMNLDEIKKAVQTKLKDMYLKGQIITRKEFDQHYRRAELTPEEEKDVTNPKLKNFFRISKGTSAEKSAQKEAPHLMIDQWYKKGDDLTRIWGAEHLSAKGFKVPRYLLVIDGNLDDIKVEIALQECDPMLLLLKNGTIYAETIRGTPVAAPYFRDLGGSGYTDTSSPGNILKTPQGENYFIDTENKSFYDGHPWQDQKKRLANWSGFKKVSEIPINQFVICDYLKKRFMLTNGIAPSPSIIDLIDLTVSVVNK